MYPIFISYKRSDKEKVDRIKNFIEKETGLKCWIDMDGIESDAQFANVIIRAINECTVFLFMYSISHSYIKDYDNDWTIREINFAQKKMKRIVFINIDGTKLTDWFELIFGTKQQIDAKSSVAMKHLTEDIKKWIETERDCQVQAPDYGQDKLLKSKAKRIVWDKEKCQFVEADEDEEIDDDLLENHIYRQAFY